jgi:hypothetical protein
METPDKRKSKARIRVQTNLSLPPDTRDKIEKWARQYYVSMTDIIVDAVNKYDKIQQSKP